MVDRPMTDPRACKAEASRPEGRFFEIQVKGDIQ
jgi:hypothetical protein